MFEKKKELISSLIGSDITITGDISGEGSLEIHGKVEGDISINNVKIAPSSYIRGTLECENAEISGEVIGSVRSSKVYLFNGSKLYGDIFYDALSIETGAVVHGRCISKNEALQSSEYQDNIEIEVIQRGSIKE